MPRPARSGDTKGMSRAVLDVSRTWPPEMKASARRPSHFISYAHPASSAGSVPVVASIGRRPGGGLLRSSSTFTPRSLHRATAASPAARRLPWAAPAGSGSAHALGAVDGLPDDVRVAGALRRL